MCSVLKLRMSSPLFFNPKLPLLFYNPLSATLRGVFLWLLFLSSVIVGRAQVLIKLAFCSVAFQAMTEFCVCLIDGSGQEVMFETELNFGFCSVNDLFYFVALDPTRGTEITCSIHKSKLPNDGKCIQGVCQSVWRRPTSQIFKSRRKYPHGCMDVHPRASPCVHPLRKTKLYRF